MIRNVEQPIIVRRLGHASGSISQHLVRGLAAMFAVRSAMRGESIDPERDTEEVMRLMKSAPGEGAQSPLRDEQLSAVLAQFKLMATECEQCMVGGAS